MNVRACIGLAAVLLGAIGPAAASRAEAAVIAYSGLQIRNLQASIPYIDQYAVNFHFGSASSAELSWGPGVVSDDYLNGDAELSCLGACGGIGQNDFTQASSGPPAATQEFVRGDSQVRSSIPGAESLGPMMGAMVHSGTVAELNLLSPTISGTAASLAGFQGAFGTLNIPIGDITFGFDAVGSLLASSDDPAAAAGASLGWALQIFDGAVLVAEFAPDALNQEVGVSGSGFDNYAIDQHFTFTVSGLLPGHGYTLATTQRSAAGGWLNEPPPGVPEPGAWALMLLGFGGLGAQLRRRRAGLAPSAAG